MTQMETVLAGERWTLYASGAAFWQCRRTLFVADLHIGKTATFRAAALPLPAGATATTLARLDASLASSQAERLVVLGDLLHARAGRARKTLAAVSAWRARWPNLDALLVRGNHDRSAGDPPVECGFRCVDEPFAEPPFVYRHYPEESADGYVLAGHVHPAVKLLGVGGAAVRVACFHFGQRVGVLPAFGDFTGAARIRPKLGDLVYGLADGEILPLHE